MELAVDAAGLEDIVFAELAREVLAIAGLLAVGPFEQFLAAIFVVRRIDGSIDLRPRKRYPVGPYPAGAGERAAAGSVLELIVAQNA